MTQEYDEIGIWSEVKLAIVRDYLPAYTTILNAQRGKAPSLQWIYIDAYAGPGYHLSKRTGETVEGSPLIALGVTPAFSEYHFIDTNPKRVLKLRELAGPRGDVFTYDRDCNEVLLKEVFPRATWSAFRRAVCLLDPYNIDLTWEVIETAGKMGTIELFLNFMIMDINRNALRRDPSKAIPSKVAQMTRLCGGDEWLDIGYDKQDTLFGEVVQTKVSNERVSEWFRKRLMDKAGFKYVPKPMPMKTKTNSVIYYLYFAGHKTSASNIVTDIFDKYRVKQGL
ncbi:MAG: three-Cys-motif partner protein TcmP [Acidobacteriaceae bacterium]